MHLRLITSSRWSTTASPYPWCRSDRPSSPGTPPPVRCSAGLMSHVSPWTSDWSSSCRAPHLADPYEAIFVEVRQSGIKDAGQGLWARTDIEPGTIISFYNGLKVILDDLTIQTVLIIEGEVGGWLGAANPLQDVAGWDPGHWYPGTHDQHGQLLCHAGTQGIYLPENIRLVLC